MTGVADLDLEEMKRTRFGSNFPPPVTVPPNTTRLSIASGGEVRATIAGQTQTLGQMELARFVNPSGLGSVGNNLFVERPSSGPPLTGPPGSRGMGMLVQGSLEGSNVDLAREFVMDILSSVHLKANCNALETQNEMLGTMLDIKT